MKEMTSNMYIRYITIENEPSPPPSPGPRIKVKVDEMFCWWEKSAPPPHTRSEPMLRVYYFTLYVCIYEVAYIKKK